MEVLEDKLRSLSIARRSHPEKPTYLLGMAQQPEGVLAVSCSNMSIHLHNKETLKLQGEYRGHGGPLCALAFAHASPHLLYSASADGTVRAWDARLPGSKSAQLFRSDSSHSFCSFDLSCGNVLLCAGTEQVDKADSFLVFWDARKPGESPLGVYSESHSDDITQVRFHPRDKDRMASCATDGLVNVFDLSRGSEDEALLATFNGDSCASSVCWCGDDYRRLLCLSQDEGLHLWDLSRLDTEQPLAVFSCRDVRSLAPTAPGRRLDYTVGGAWLEDAGKLLVVGGDNAGGLHLMECDDGGLRLLKSLHGGHASTVRCFLWDAVAGALFTGGEDAQLLLWKPGGAELTSVKKESMKSCSALKVKSRPHRKHYYNASVQR
ncbi:WD repeat-containing protein 89 [Nerophis lumbriciformis]|uniref:WD repeat-containing protein 89 n=1 Tax=Nerophis lumbriciformis TaxID=546530 RepID=UPI003BA8C394